MIHKRSIEVECLRAGQPRPYADSTYEYILRFKGDKEDGGGWGSRPNTESVKQLAQILVRPFVEGPEWQWYQGKLEDCTQIEPGVWHVQVREAFLD